MSVRSDFPVAFREFIFNRTCIQIGEDMLTDPEYQVFAQKANSLYREIVKVLGGKGNMVSDMENALNGCEGVAMRQAYAQGLHDGISMLKELNLLDVAPIPRSPEEACCQ